MSQFRGVVFLIWMYGLILILGLLFLPVLVLPISWARWPVDLWLKMMFWGIRVLLGVRIVVEGREHIPDGGALIAPKHQSMFDVLIPWQLFSFPALILKQELAWLPVFGWYVMKLKNVAIDRKGGAGALRKMVRQAATLAANQRQILIFPEGTRVLPGAKAPYKSGVAALYKEMNVPCVPIALNSGLCWPAHGLNFRPGTIIVRVLPPIPPGLDRRAFMQQLEHSIETASDELSRKDNNV